MDRGITTKKAMPPGTVVRGFLQIGSDIIDCGASRIINRDPPVKITPKVLAVLLELARHQGETVARDTLLDTVWAETHPTPDVVKQAILEIRRAFESPDNPSEIVETIPRLGYRLLVGTRFSETLEGLSEPERSPEQNAQIDTAAAEIAWPVNGKFFNRHAKWIPAAALVLLAIAVPVFYQTVKTKIATAENPLAAPEPEPLSFRMLTSNLGKETMPVISPDGSRVAYVVENEKESTARIRLQTIDGHGASWLNVLSGRQEMYPVWSGDGASLSYMSMKKNDCTIVAKPAIGGEEHLLSSCWPSFLQYYDWSSNGKLLALSQYPSSKNMMGRIVEADLERQTERYLDYQKSEASADYEPRYSPDGRYIAFRRGIQPFTDLFVYDKSKNSTRQLTRFGASLKGFSWTPSGQYLVLSSNHNGRFSLYALRVADGKLIPLGIDDAEFPSMARQSQTVAFAKTRVTRRIADVSLQNRKSPATLLFAGSTGSDQEATFSSDGNMVALVSNRSGVEQVWLGEKQHPEKELLQITSFNGERLSQINWSPDAKKLLVVASSGTRSRLYIVDMARRVQKVITAENLYVQQAVFGNSEQDIWLAARQGDRAFFLWHGQLMAEKYEFKATNRPATEVKWIPEGERIVVNPSARHEYVVYDKNLEKIQSYSLSLMPMFARVKDGSLWYLGIAEKQTGLYRMSFETGKSELVRDGFEVQWSYPWFDIASDGTSLLVTQAERDDTDIAVTTLPTNIR